MKKLRIFATAALLCGSMQASAAQLTLIPGSVLNTGGLLLSFGAGTLLNPVLGPLGGVTDPWTRLGVLTVTSLTSTLGDTLVGHGTPLAGLSALPSLPAMPALPGLPQ